MCVKSFFGTAFSAKSTALGKREAAVEAAGRHVDGELVEGAFSNAAKNCFQWREASLDPVLSTSLPLFSPGYSIYHNQEEPTRDLSLPDFATLYRRRS